MAGPRDPRNFLYDDYYGHEPNNEREPEYQPRASERAAPRRHRENLDMELDDYSQRRGTVGLLGRRQDYDSDRGYESPPAAARPNARRFANAMGLDPRARVSHDYDDLDYGLPPNARTQRVLYREPPPVARVRPMRRQVIGRRGLDEDYEYEDVDLPRRRRVVEVIERVRRPLPRRVQIVKKIPIRQRVVKKIIVQRVQRPSFAPNRRQSNGIQGRVGRVQNRGGGVQKKKVLGGPGTSQGGGRSNKKTPKPQLSTSELDRELDEYMRGNKHPRVNV